MVVTGGSGGGAESILPVIVERKDVSRGTVGSTGERRRVHAAAAIQRSDGQDIR